MNPGSPVWQTGVLVQARRPPQRVISRFRKYNGSIKNFYEKQLVVFWIRKCFSNNDHYVYE